jgi:hypothetical protein
MKERRWLPVVIVFVLIAGTAAFLGRLQSGRTLGKPGLKLVESPIFDPEGVKVSDHSIYLPERALGYTSEIQPVTQAELGYLPADTSYGRRRYAAPDGAWIDASVVLMGTDRTSIHKPQFCLTGQGWIIDRTERVRVPMSRPHPYDLPATRLDAGRKMSTRDGRTVEARGIYVYWFVSDQRLTGEHWERMWWTVQDLSFQGVLPRWAYVAYFAVCLPGQEDATYERITELMRATVPEFQLVAGPVSLSQRADAGQ